MVAVDLLTVLALSMRSCSTAAVKSEKYLLRTMVTTFPWFDSKLAASEINWRYETAWSDYVRLFIFSEQSTSFVIMLILKIPVFFWLSY